MTDARGSSAEEELDRLIRRQSGLVRAKLAPFAEGPDHLEDLLQETWTRCLDRWEQFRGGQRMAWVLAIARSIAVDDYRARKRREAGRRLHQSNPVPDAGSRWDIDEIREELGRAFHALTKREAEVVQLRFLSDQSTRSVASTLGISESTVRVHLANALGKLRGAMVEEEP